MPEKQKRARFLRRFLPALLCCLLLWMFIGAQTVRLSAATLPLRDLPAAFSGTRVLYVSDLCVNTLNSSGKVNRLLAEISRAEPDLLLLGGDYSSFEPLMRITAAVRGVEPRAVEADMRDRFFRGLADIHPPLGKFGVAGENDNLLERNGGGTLASAMALGGVTLLKDQALRIEKDGAALVLLGVDDWSTGMQDTRGPASQVAAGDCVILLCHNPEAVPTLLGQPAADGGEWIDLALTGHTHGGSVKIAGRELFNPLGADRRYQSGWHRESGAKVLISNGVGNRWLPLRLNAAPQAHLITLVRSNGF